MERKFKQGKFYSPLRYPGGKSCIFPFVSRLFYENSLIGMSYAEPYAGGAGLALKLLFEGFVEKIFINDFDRAIYSFWKTIINDPDDFCNWVEKTNVNVKNWYQYKKIQSAAATANVFDLAKSTFYLNRTNISGVIKGGPIGGLNQLGKYKIDARFNKKELIERIQKIASFRDRIIVSNLDGIAFINKIKKRQEEIFIYIDPPYYQKGADLYMNFYAKKDHQLLSKHISKINVRWMVSYDNHEFILNLYSGNKKVIYKLSQCASNRVGDEVLMFSEGLDFSTSMKALSSATLLDK